MAPVMVCVVDTGMPSAGGEEQRHRAAGLGAEAAHRLELGDALAHRLDDAPAAEQRAQADGEIAAPDHPGWRHRRRSPPRVAGGDQQHPDDADRLLRVVAAVAERIQARRDELQAAEPVVHPQRRRAPADPRHRHHQQRAEQETEQRRHEDEGHRLEDAAADQVAGARLGHHRADDAADQRVRRARRDAVPPGQHVPGDGADQRAEHHVVVDDAGLDDALADGGGDTELEDEDRDEVEERREHHRLVRLQHAGGDDGGDRVRRVVEAVHEVERQRQRHQQRDHPETDLDGLHQGSPIRPAQEFSRTTPSIRLATSSQRSVIDSRCS